MASATPMRVLHLINSLQTGGAESLLVEFAAAAERRRDVDIEVCTLYSRNDFVNQTKDLRHSIRSLDLISKYDPDAIHSLRKVIIDRQYRIIHVHLFPATLFAAVATVGIPGLTLVCTEHSLYTRRRKYPFLRYFDGIVSSRYRAIVCIGNAVRDSLISWTPAVAERSVVIPNGIRIVEPDNCSEKEFDVIYVGRLEYVKGPDVLLHATAVVRERYGMRIRVGVIGDGSLMNSLRKLAERLGISDMLHFLGSRSDVRRLMGRSRVLVIPSRSEGFGLVAIEAMSMRVPVVGSNVGGIAEIIDDGRTGLLVPPEMPEAIAEALHWLLLNRSLAETIASSAQIVVKDRYSIEKYTDSIIEFYRSLVSA